MTQLLAKRRKAQILVIEDNSDQWFLTDWALKNRFPEVEPVWKATAEDALIYLESQLEGNRQLPVLILLDLYLPKPANGWALLEIIKNHHVYRTTPVIMLSHSDRQDDIVRSYDLRINAYMIKPIADQDWLDEMEQFRRYWWDAVTLLAS